MSVNRARRDSIHGRPGRFIAVGVAGFAVQLAALWTLTTRAHWPWLPATIAAVEAAIVHNFLWHRTWTWRERFASGASVFESSTLASFARFNAATAVTSIGGNVAAMAVLAGLFHLPVLAANALAVTIMTLANYLASDRWVFGSANGARVASAYLLIAALPATAWAAPRAEVLDAWTRYVADTERRIDSGRPGGPGAPASAEPSGTSVDVNGGTISHWRGQVMVPGITVGRLLERLQVPGTPPPQEDVVASRVLGRGPDTLHVYIRLVRRAIVTVTYDTEHEMSFRRLSPSLATARSVATRIDEVGGGDKGFLWRLHSYWRYEQRGDGVLVSLESLTLSRDVPFLLKPVAGRIVPRIASESVARTLDALKRYLAAA
jgi:putative flippase GtrA